MMSTSKVSPTTHWYTDKFFDRWLIDVANSENPPLVFSISYGAEEQLIADFNADTLDAFDIQAAKLGVMGVTIVASSGDDGANTRDYRVGMNPRGSCGYVMSFPASSPYVTAIGATQGPELTSDGTFNGEEIVCSARTHGGITSGGGFSNHYMRSDAASYQNDIVNAYLLKVAGTSKAPKAGFNFSVGL
jgi:subtilase family serine protease